MATLEIKLRVANAIGDVLGGGVGRLRQSADESQNRMPSTARSTDIAGIAENAPKSRVSTLADHIIHSYHMTFLSSLELSARSAPGPAGSRCILLAETAAGELLGAVPCYAKSHSQGEYVFDHGWADAYERAGGSYYPKLQVSVPFTPATGRRLLMRPGRRLTRSAMYSPMRSPIICKRSNASSVHVTFLPEAGMAAARRARLSAAHPPSVPLGERRLRHLR